jgi:glucose-1-phosphate adenylyltransferase
VPVPLSEARSFGVVEIDHDLRVRRFVEKSDQAPPMPDDPTQALASMGIYVFTLSFLLDILAEDGRAAAPQHDFGRDILPGIVESHTVGAYGFGGVEGRVTPDRYWRDVGTLDAYYEANMDLLKPIPPLNLHQKDWAIRTYHGQYPPARNGPSSSGEAGSVTNTLLTGGDVIIGAQTVHSILSPDVWVDEGAVVEDSILFEGVRVGSRARVRRCIIDKAVRIPPNETIGWDLEQDRRRFTVSEGGVVVVPKGYRFDSEPAAGLIEKAG